MIKKKILAENYREGMLMAMASLQDMQEREKTRNALKGHVIKNVEIIDEDDHTCTCCYRHGYSHYASDNSLKITTDKGIIMIKGFSIIELEE
jgi:hypothetical protein